MKIIAVFDNGGRCEMSFGFWDKPDETPFFDEGTLFGNLFAEYHIITNAI